MWPTGFALPFGVAKLGQSIREQMGPPHLSTACCDIVPSGSVAFGPTPAAASLLGLLALATSAFGGLSN